MFPGYKQSLFRFLIILMTVILPVTDTIAADTASFRKTGSMDFAEIDSDIAWLEEADRLKAELTSLDVRMYTLINTVRNEDSRKALIKQRNINRKLIYDLIYSRNIVIERLRQNRQALNSQASLASFRRSPKSQ